MAMTKEYRVRCDNIYCIHEDVIDSDDIVTRDALARNYFKESGWIFEKVNGRDETFCGIECSLKPDSKEKV